MKYTFFWDGPFSQWNSSHFTVDGVKYNTAEQYMMSRKAYLFNDFETLGKIMKATWPREQKALGKEVRDFNPDLWTRWCRKFVYDGNMAKFNQNPALLRALQGTIGTMLVEASPYDKIWGIGIGPDDPKRLNPENWDGTNYLGEVLNQVRLSIFNDSTDTELFTKAEWLTPEVDTPPTFQ